MTIYFKLVHVSLTFFESQVVTSNKRYGHNVASITNARAHKPEFNLKCCLSFKVVYLETQVIVSIILGKVEVLSFKTLISHINHS